MRIFIATSTLAVTLFSADMSFAQCAGCDADFNRQDRAETESIYQRQQIDQSHDQTKREIDSSLAPQSVKDEYKTQNEELRELDQAAEEMGVGSPTSSQGSGTH